MTSSNTSLRLQQKFLFEFKALNWTFCTNFKYMAAVWCAQKLEVNNPFVPSALWAEKCFYTTNNIRMNNKVEISFDKINIQSQQ